MERKPLRQAELTSEQLYDLTREEAPSPLNTSPRTSITLAADGEFAVPAEVEANASQFPDVIETTPEVLTRRPGEFNPSDNMFKLVDNSDLELFAARYVDTERLESASGLEASAAVDLPWATLPLDQIAYLLTENGTLAIRTSDDTEARYPLGLVRKKGQRFFVPAELMEIISVRDKWWKFLWRLPIWLARRSRTRYGLKIREIHQIVNPEHTQVTHTAQEPRILWEEEKHEVRVVLDDFKIKNKSE